MIRLVVIALVFVSAVGTLIILGVSSSMPVLKVPELLAHASKHPGQAVQLDGCKIVAIESRYPLRFEVAADGDSTRPIPVVSERSPPENFDVGKSVMLQGVYDLEQRNFDASTIITKCPSRYEATEQAKKAEREAKAAEDSNGK